MQEDMWALETKSQVTQSFFLTSIVPALDSDTDFGTT